MLSEVKVLCGSSLKLTL